MSTEVAISIDEARPPDAGGAEIEVSIVMPCLNEADTLDACIAQGASGVRRQRHPRRNHRRRQWLDGSIRRHREGGAGACGARHRTRLRQRADGRDRGRARQVRDHGRRRRAVTTSSKCRDSWRRCVRVTTSCRAAACRPAAAPSCRARCRSCTGGGAIRCSRPWRGGGSRRPSTTCTADFAGSPGRTTTR